MKQPFRNQKLGKIVSRTIKHRPYVKVPKGKGSQEQRVPTKKP